MIQNIQNLKREGSVGWGRLTFSLQRESWALSSKSNPAFPAADAPGAKCIQQENEVGEWKKPSEETSLYHKETQQPACTAGNIMVCFLTSS